MENGAIARKKRTTGWRMNAGYLLEKGGFALNVTLTS
jgi:hypothetical protein